MFVLTEKAFRFGLWASSLHNERYFFCVFQANEGKREASEERLPQSHVSGSPRFNEKISPVMQATGVKEIKPILLVSRRPRNSILYRGEFGHGIAAKIPQVRDNPHLPPPSESDINTKSSRWDKLLAKGRGR